jgi:adenosylcobinamide kinase / adenosylcobinamide-phosphate guanylyltransferase
MSPGMENHKKSVTLVLGGAQSGKSYYAQQVAAQFEHVTFIATGRTTDAEMRRKIARHRRERPAGWKTIESPLDLHEAIRSESQDAHVILVDCLTVYVANVMGARKSKSNPKECIESVCEAIRESKACVVVVSNEVGSGVVPPYRSGRIYRDLLGQMNQQIAQIADKVVLMIAGMPVTVKNAKIQERSGDASLAGVTLKETGSANGGGKRHSRAQAILK